MTAFAKLFKALEATTKTNQKKAALVDYFHDAPPEEACWGLFCLLGKKSKRVVPTKILRETAISMAGISPWCFEICYGRVGDLSETIALLIGNVDQKSNQLQLKSIFEDIFPYLATLDVKQKSQFLKKWYANKSIEEIFLFNKLITGGFRIGVSSGIVIKALSEYSRLDETLLATRLAGDWQPSAAQFKSCLAPPSLTEATQSRLQPFMLAYPLTQAPESLGAIEDWHVEWKWDGIRAQCIIENGEVQLWSRGEEMINDTFPDVVAAAKACQHDCILDGEIVAWENDVLPFHLLQKRLNRKTVSKKLLEEVPCIFIAFDCLAYHKKDLKTSPFCERRQTLEQIRQDQQHIHISQPINASTWHALAEKQQRAREYYAEGFMLKAKDSSYVRGRKTGLWWKWKIEPMTIDAVLIQAQRGHGRRAGLFSDYTFAVWDDTHENLVTFAKAYSGLTDKEMAEVDQFVKTNVLERFGPVVSVNAERVFEIAFEGIQPSNRHKSGVAVRFPRIVRVRDDKTPEQANTLSDLHALLDAYGR